MVKVVFINQDALQPTCFPDSKIQKTQYKNGSNPALISVISD